ncbi:MAG: hypothetical protein IPH36_19755 [Saprospiraceae bacterium]|nr:hypothetical protein [Saprospiraceae bacterium]
MFWASGRDVAVDGNFPATNFKFTQTNGDEFVIIPMQVNTIDKSAVEFHGL